MVLGFTPISQHLTDLETIPLDKPGQNHSFFGLLVQHAYGSHSLTSRYNRLFDDGAVFSGNDLLFVVPNDTRKNFDHFPDGPF